MKTYEEILSEIEFEVTRLKLNDRHVYYAFSIDIPAETASRLRNHFTKEGYNVEIIICPRKKFDIILEWVDCTIQMCL